VNSIITIIIGQGLISAVSTRASTFQCMYIYIYIYIHTFIYLFIHIGQGLISAVSTRPSTFQCCPRDQYGNLRDDANSFFLSTEIFLASLTSSGKEVVSVRSTYDANVHCFNFEYTPLETGIFELDITYQSWYDEPKSLVYGAPFLVSINSNTNSEGSKSDISASLTYAPSSSIAG
jgi:hypothetical protein